MSVFFENVRDEASLIKGVIDLRDQLETANHVNSLVPEAFSSRPHQVIWSAIQMIMQAGGIIDSWQLRKAMATIGASEEDYQFMDTYFTDASYSNGSTSDLTPRVKSVAEAFKRREISRLCSSISENAMVLPMAEIESQFADLSNKVASAGTSSIRIGTNYAKQFDRILSGKPILDEEARQNLVKFGVPGIDDVLMANPGRLIFIGGLPSAGKTAFALQAAIETALIGKRVAMGSLEMDEDEIGARLVANCCGIDSLDAMRASNIPRVDAEGSRKLSLLRANMVGLHGCAGDSWTAMEAAIVREHRRAPLSLAILDYLQLLEAPETKGKRQDNEAQRIGEITKAAKRLAQRLKIDVLLLSQFNREVEETKEPSLQNFLGSGQIERDADIALLMWNARINYEKGEDREINLRIAKNRGGARYGKVRMNFNPALNRFVEDVRETDPYHVKIEKKKKFV